MDNKTEPKPPFPFDVSGFYDFFAGSFQSVFFKNRLEPSVGMNISKPNKVSQFKIKAISDYNILLDKVCEESKLITKHLKSFNFELSVSIENTKKIYPDHKEEYKKLMETLRNNSIFHRQKGLSIARDKYDDNEDLLGILKELLSSYPEPNFSNLSTVEEIKMAYADLEKHHQNTIDAASDLFKNLNNDQIYKEGETHKSQTKDFNLSI